MSTPSLYLKALRGVQFTNYTCVDVSFSPRLNLILGPNGAGKTNLLDAVYYLSMLRSAVARMDAQRIQRGTTGFRLTGDFVRQEQSESIICKLQPPARKQVQIDGVPCVRLRTHLGRYPVVLLRPAAQVLVDGSAVVRRRFFDQWLCQCSAEYTLALATYTQVLMQRNALLRQYSEQGRIDKDLLAAYTNQLIAPGQVLYRARAALMPQLLTQLQTHYAILAGEQEAVSIHYRPQLVTCDEFGDKLQEKQATDLRAQRTTVGPHKDDYLFILAGEPLVYWGSQGQQKSFIIALHLAQRAHLQQSLGYAPLLLLDDIFGQLDDQRVRGLLQAIQATNSQVLLTEARDASMLPSGIELSARIIQVRNGVATSIYDAKG